MYLVAVHRWQQEATVVAEIIAAALNILIFEARQKITGGEPVTIASFADQNQAEELATKLNHAEVPALVIDSQWVRSHNRQQYASRFELGAQTLQVETSSGELLNISYETIDLLLLATCCAGQIEATSTQRKFSLGKTLLAGGIPRTKKIKTTETLKAEERDKTLWIYTSTGETLVFTCNGMSYTGLGEARQITRELNFTYLLKELQRLAPQACYNDRLLTRVGQVQLLGPMLNPESDLDLAFEILSRSLRADLY
ncbi:MAG: hypothetical protein KAG93_02775 [Desulfuromusa sp.]|nr:hypothetical protein [Desulfuromusa sp.]